MSVSIRLIKRADIASVVQLSLAAWDPASRSFEEILGSDIYHIIWPHWQKSQREEVEVLCQASLVADNDVTTWVAEGKGEIAGFIAVKLNRSDQSGEVEMLAVSPSHQRQGIGAALNQHALNYMLAEGMRLAIVETAGDPSHEAARRSYKNAGYTQLPIARYYQVLSAATTSVNAAGEE